MDSIKIILRRIKCDNKTKEEIIKNLISLKEEEENMESGKNLNINDDKKKFMKKNMKRRQKNKTLII